MRDFAIAHSQIRLVVNNQNLGPGQSRNVAWNLVTSEYLAFLDADDTWHPKKIDVSRRTCKRMPLTTGLNHGADLSIVSAARVAKTCAATE
ncbi:MAG: glycosyltransferase [Acidimicrobiaceae bacterium]